jgi:hypothetical protein
VQLNRSIELDIMTLLSNGLNIFAEANVTGVLRPRFTFVKPHV